MNPAILQQPFFQVTLPLLFGLWLASVYAGKRFEDLKEQVKQRFDQVDKKLEAIETRLTSVERKVEALEVKAWR